MRFRLANGNVVAKTNQPLQNKDFDRLTINAYDGSYVSNDCIEDDFDYKPDPSETNGPSQSEFEISLFNPSSRTIYKSNCRIKPTIGIINDSRTKTCESSSETGIRLNNLHHGENIFHVVPDVLAHTDSHSWTGFGSSAQKIEGSEARDYGPSGYENDTYSVTYRATLLYTNRKRRRKNTSENSLTVNYKVRI